MLEVCAGPFKLEIDAIKAYTRPLPSFVLMSSGMSSHASSMQSTLGKSFLSRLDCSCAVHLSCRLCCVCTCATLNPDVMACVSLEKLAHQGCIQCRLYDIKCCPSLMLRLSHKEHQIMLVMLLSCSPEFYRVNGDAGCSVSYHWLFIQNPTDLRSDSVHDNVSCKLCGSKLMP